MKERSLFSRTISRYLEAVYDDPGNDEARMRYAVWACGRGLAHGALVDLQMAATTRPLTPAERATESALLADHGRIWLGPLAPVVRSVRFQRGFPAHLTISASREADLRAIEGHPAYATVESIEFEHVQGGLCRRTGSVQIGLGHAAFRGLRSISGVYGATLLEASRVHRRLEALAWFVPPEATGSMPPAPPPVVVAQAIAEFSGLQHLRIGNDAVTTSDDVDDEIAATLLSGQRRPARVSIRSDHRRIRGWIRRMKKFPVGELELRSDGCGTMQHAGMALTLHIVDHNVQPRARAVFDTETLQPERYELRTFVAALPILAREGVEVVEVMLPDPTRDGALLLRAMSNARHTVPNVDIRQT
ncbi:hypothetical protein LZC95_20280 [Pendulispora brunnea]|uniref:Uncharacterized protein n=1 Tax=Pendulispora brunnea TaxID=2905690 RepID=A0ABZ2KKE5_9BACT